MTRLRIVGTPRSFRRWHIRAAISALETLAPSIRVVSPHCFMSCDVLCTVASIAHKNNPTNKLPAPMLEKARHCPGGEHSTWAARTVTCSISIFVSNVLSWISAWTFRAARCIWPVSSSRSSNIYTRGVYRAAMNLQLPSKCTSNGGGGGGKEGEGV